MGKLTIYKDNNPEEIVSKLDCPTAIAEELDKIGVVHETWDITALSDDMSDDDVLKIYEADIERLKETGGYQSYDIVRLFPDNDNKCDLRNKFLSEHTHSEDEVRFFVEGSGMFYIHAHDNVYMILCEQGDLISVPEKAKHWFDMGENPKFTCIRIFTSPDGWAADYTGDNIADKFPKFEEKAA